MKALNLKKEAVPTLFLGSGNTAEQDLPASSSSNIQDPAISMDIQDGSEVELQEHSGISIDSSDLSLSTTRALL